MTEAVDLQRDPVDFDDAVLLISQLRAVVGIPQKQKNPAASQGDGRLWSLIKPILPVGDVEPGKGVTVEQITRILFSDGATYPGPAILDTLRQKMNSEVVDCRSSPTEFCLEYWRKK